MSTKTIIISLIGVILIGGAVYFTMSKGNSKMTSTIPPVQTTQEETSLAGNNEVTMEPNKDASTDEIIDYIVDGQSDDETKAAQASLETSATVEAEPTISTNF